MQAKGIVVPTEKFNEVAGTSYLAVQVTVMPNGVVHLRRPSGASYQGPKLSTAQVAKLIHDMYEELNAFRAAAVKHF